MTGWVCGKCGISNAPWVSQCPCGPTITVSGGTNIPPLKYGWTECQHDFRPSDTSLAGSVCRKCSLWMPPPEAPTITSDDKARTPDD